MLDVRRLRLLRELQLRGTLAAVAVAENLSPSAVSQQLNVLEREVGLPLLRRSGRRVVLTAHAEVLAEHAAIILAQLELAQSDLDSGRSVATGLVRVAVFQSAALAIIPDALSLLGAREPEVRTLVTQREPETALEETWLRDFDLVVAEQYPGHAAPHFPGLDRSPLLTDALRLATPPDSPITALADASGHPWVMEPPGAASRHWAEQLCRRAGFEPDVRFETGDLQAHVRLVASGHAVAILPDLIWAGGAAGSVRSVGLPGAPRRAIFTAARRSTASRPAIRAWRAALKDAASRILLPD